MTVTFNTTPAFDRGLAGLIYGAKLNARTVVEKETGELLKTLARVSLPADVNKTKRSIERDIANKFSMAGVSGNSRMEREGKLGGQGIKWYQVDGQYLRGVAPEADKRKATADELAPLRWRITKRGRLNLAFKHPHQRQRVLLYQTILTTKATVRKVIARAQARVGRRAAGWLVAVGSGVIKLTGANQPPKTVTRHLAGARGTFIDGLAIPNFPKFTIINRAKGITAKGMAGQVAAALKIRAGAMQKNALLFMSGKKKIADYAR